jgi:hypothetical protein
MAIACFLDAQFMIPLGGEGDRQTTTALTMTTTTTTTTTKKTTKFELKK